MASQSLVLKVIENKNSVVWLDSSLLSQDCQEIFSAEYWRSQGCITGSGTGRGTTWFIRFDALELALRHYRRGGLFGKWVADSYWFSCWRETRSYQEFMLLNHLRNAGVNVPRPIAARAKKNGLFYHADLLSEKIPNACDLAELLQEKTINGELYHKIGSEIRKMHDNQVNHIDLNIHNILIDDQETVWIIDFDKCYIKFGRNWQAKNLARLKRSFRKEVKRLNIQWKETDWQQIMNGYLS
ncbi:3-deoxy-D-manno-octulosonic acid kinase [Vibrio cholerae HE48]|uniref:3-deoxy-D-manno-octulosonic acid kinase n=1 Tax=Vibrio cholerae TaxID=666 RepID=UPI0001BACF17|nr:3-deoxy-D-manno-octulosonic acid kinase [Vibrio cholerae]EEY50258.1 3-deoxy-D-manno-octulosonic acid kinase [Vibrio cholerae CT 5369-93]EGR10559.1 3-deoxy-D-manno-octulosonic acid kinase [Vibrio cholerae HE48]MEB5557622.1 3-deoxy-D-manno-octulosonic acid kinase [Vibrio cholerae]GIB60886.1 3-deoxy-D-manno-octulosonic acid kinase [Vibrio cholerae]HBC3478237.1 3-deoxy-D-manno-octulosonic acid kinase [Vibrio cholerae]